MTRRGVVRSFLAAALLVGCSAAVPRATVSAVDARPLEPVKAPARPRAIGPESIIEVVGTDTITGDHVVKVGRFHGTVSIDEPITCDFVIDMSSLRAESSIVEDFIKSPRFLDVHRYPEARFVATRVRGGRGAYTVEGRLSLHGVDKEISFPATLDSQQATPHVRANFLLPRRAFNLVLTGAFETLLEDDIRVHLDLAVGAPL